MKRVVLVECLVVLAACSSAALGAIRNGRTGVTYTTIQSAIDAAATNDTIQIDSGTYTGWSTISASFSKSVTILGVGDSRPVLDAQNMCLNSLGIFEITGGTITIDNIDFRNCQGASGANGCGIRLSAPQTLTIRNCYFYNNEDGIMGANNSNANITVEYCEFNHNGVNGDGHTHNIYVGTCASFTMRYSYSHNTNIGHEVKTRASKNYIWYNRIGNEGGNGSYEIDAPQGGTTYIIGNQIEQSATSGNSIIIAYAEEGATAGYNSDLHLYVVNNTIVNNKGSGTFVNVAAGTALLQNNIFQGGGTVYSGTVTNNSPFAGNANLADVAAYDYHLTAASTGCINLGTVPSPSTGVDGTSLIPTLEYVHPYSYKARAVNGPIDIGAYEFGTAYPTVTVEQAAGQADPTNGATINFTATFSENVTGFATGGVTLSGTAGATTALVTGGPAVYNIAVTGMTANGTVIASIAANVAQNAGSYGNAASTSVDNTVTYNATAPIVTVEQATQQADPTNGGTINFTATFNKNVTDFATGDVTLSGTAGATTAVVTGGPQIFNIAVSGMTTSGTVIASIAGNVAHDAGGNGNLASTSVDNTVTYDVTVPTVTVEQAAGQADPTKGTTINFTVTFSKNVTGFTSAGVTRSGTAGGTIAATVTGGPAVYNVAFSGMTTSGTVIASVASNVAHDAIGNGNTASTSVDNTVTYDNVAPTVTVEQAASQADPTNSSTINFTATFSENVTGFTASGVRRGGTAGATTTVVTGGPRVYNIAISGMTTSGTVTASIRSSRAQDLAGNYNLASTSTDGTVTYDNVAPTVTVEQAAGQADLTSVGTINFTATFSENVTGFVNAGVTLDGTAGATTAVVSGGPKVYNIAVSGMARSGTVTASITSNKAQDTAGNGNMASTSVDNSVIYTDNTPPTVSVGNDIAVYENELVSLHATASDHDNDPFTYAWSQTAGPVALSSTGTTGADYSFVVPTLSSRVGNTMTFSVTVNNGRGGTASASVNAQVYLAGDVSHDWTVNVGDLQLLIAAWGTDNSGAWSNWNANADLNGDNFVNVSDLQIMVINWGKSL